MQMSILGKSPGLYKICTFVEMRDLSVLQMNYQAFQVWLHMKLTEEASFNEDS